MKSRASFAKALFVCAAACALAACGGGGDDNNNSEPQPGPSANKYVGHWQSDCYGDASSGIAVRFEVVFSQHGNGKDLLAHERADIFTDLNCTQPMDEPVESDGVLTWLHEEFADMHGRQVLTDAFLSDDSLPKSPHDWSDLLYQEGDTLWWYSYDEDDPDDNEFMPLHRKK